MRWDGETNAHTLLAQLLSPNYSCNIGGVRYDVMGGRGYQSALADMIGRDRHVTMMKLGTFHV